MDVFGDCSNYQSKLQTISLVKLSLCIKDLSNLDAVIDMIINAEEVNSTSQNTSAKSLTDASSVGIRFLKEPQAQTPDHVKYVVCCCYTVRYYSQGLEQHLDCWSCLASSGYRRKSKMIVTILNFSIIYCEKENSRIILLWGFNKVEIRNCVNYSVLPYLVINLPCMVP